MTWNKLLEIHYLSPAVILNPATPEHQSVRNPHLATRSSSEQPFPNLSPVHFHTEGDSSGVFFQQLFPRTACFIVLVQTPMQPQTPHPYCFLHPTGGALIHRDFVRSRYQQGIFKDLRVSSLPTAALSKHRAKAPAELDYFCCLQPQWGLCCCASANRPVLNISTLSIIVRHGLAPGCCLKQPPEPMGWAGWVKIGKFLCLCIKELLELQITYKPCQWSLDEYAKRQNKTENKLFPRNQARGKADRSPGIERKIQKSKAGHFKTSSAQLMHWLHWNYNTSVKPSLLKITFFFCVCQSSMGKCLNHRSVNQEIWALFPALLERRIPFAMGSAQTDPQSHTGVSRGCANAGVHQHGSQKSLYVCLVWCAGK